MKQWLLLAATLCASSLAIGASFDCSKAATYAEKTICANAQLGKLDEALSSNYGNMLTGNLGDGGKDLKREQRVWLHKRNACLSEQCLVDVYRSRIDEICDTPVVTGVHPDCVLASDVR